MRDLITAGIGVLAILTFAAGASITGLIEHHVLADSFTDVAKTAAACGFALAILAIVVAIMSRGRCFCFRGR
jgi:hypothetical protein